MPASEDRTWLDALRQHVQTKPCVILRLDESDSGLLHASRRGLNEFTLARAHELCADTDKLEVFTANRRDLEHVFGVDLIYLNLTKKNIVMVQYKMLEPNSHLGEPTDWLYRPDPKMADEVRRMRAFASTHAAGPLECRLNPEMFYLKFVRRNGSLANGSIITPIDHYERLLQDPSCKGPRGAFRISYNTLGGRYIRQGAFLTLFNRAT